MNRKRKAAKRFIQPSYQSTAQGLAEPGEAGRAIPGVGDLRKSRVAAFLKGKAAVPPATGRLDISTFHTRVGGSQKLYEAERWVRVTLVLQTAGVVSVGTREELLPILSGKGALLPQNVPVKFAMSKGDKIYVAADAVDRISLIIEPIPWLEQIAQMIAGLAR